MADKALNHSAKPNTFFAQTIVDISKKCAIVLSRQAPRSGALFFRPFLLGDAKEMDKLDLKGVKHLLRIA